MASNESKAVHGDRWLQTNGHHHSRSNERPLASVKKETVSA